MAGYREFQTGEVLTAANVNDFLMDQSVMKFADAAARDTALGTAVGGANALREGMVAYLDDTDTVQFFDGTVWDAISQPPAGIGTNVVQAVKTDTFTTASSTYVDITNLSATITPTSATSKVLVLLHAVVSNTNSNDSAFVRLIRDSTAVFVGDSAGNRVQATSGTYLGNVTNALEVGFSASASFVDSPATASAVTYKAQIRVAGGIGGTATVGRGGGDSDSAQRGRFPASLVVIEVAA